MTRVYIASPYLRGDKKENVMRQINAFHVLVNNGYLPFAPLLGHYIDEHYPMSWKEWLAFDLKWLEVCDCVLRLSGESDGADAEEAYARDLGKPVYYSYGELFDDRLEVDEVFTDRV
jgi:nucleoside 2-deoxyribosyltransferase